MSSHAESSTIGIHRNDDVLSRALRDGNALGIDEIARLHRAMSPAYDASSSVASSSTAVFSSHEESTVTKPTSNAPSQPTNAHNDKGKRKCKSGYASSLSVAYGSASEAEVEHRALRRDNVRGTCDWADAVLETSRPLKDAARAKERRYRRKSKSRRPVVLHDQRRRSYGTIEERSEAVVTDGPLVNVGPVVITTPSPHGAGRRYLRQRTFFHEDDAGQRDEEGQTQSAAFVGMRVKSLSPNRVYLLSGVGALMVLTLALAMYGAYLTGKTRMSCTKGIVFGATAMLSLLTVLAMLIARRALSEALLAGLLELVFGFALLAELDDFM